MSPPPPPGGDTRADTADHDHAGHNNNLSENDNGGEALNEVDEVEYKQETAQEEFYRQAARMRFKQL